MTPASNREGLFFILVAPAGAGKNALMKRVMARVGALRQLPTATSRPRRKDEVHGREHLFVSDEEFEQMLADNLLLEHQKVHGRYYYGVPRKTVEDAMARGEDRIADIDYLGAAFIRQQYPDNVVLIFIQPPSVRTLIERMRNRGDSEAEIARRLVRVPDELAFAGECDYLILNDDIDEAAEALYGIIIAARARREVKRLRARGEQVRSQFASASVAVVVYGDRIAWRHHAPALPLALVAPGEEPHRTAMKAARDQLGIDLTDDNLVQVASEEPEAIAPASVDFIETPEGEQVALLYVYRLDTSVGLPPDWTWLPQSEARLPQPVLELLATLPT